MVCAAHSLHARRGQQRGNDRISNLILNHVGRLPAQLV